MPSFRFARYNGYFKTWIACLQTPVAERYGAISQIFHWLTAVLVLAAFLYGPGGSELRVYSPQNDAALQLHETLGLCVFVLALMRIVWRMTAPRPDPPDVVKWMGVIGTVVQYALYLLLFSVPLTADRRRLAGRTPVDLAERLADPLPRGAIARHWKPACHNSHLARRCDHVDRGNPCRRRHLSSSRAERRRARLDAAPLVSAAFETLASDGV
jgi:hypothetical protein